MRLKIKNILLLFFLQCFVFCHLHSQEKYRIIQTTGGQIYCSTDEDTAKLFYNLVKKKDSTAAVQYYEMLKTGSIVNITSGQIVTFKRVFKDGNQHFMEFVLDEDGKTYYTLANLLENVNTKGSFFLTLKEYQDFQTKLDGLQLNNFSITEDEALLSSGLRNIRVTFAARNESDIDRHFSVMMAGFSGNTILWAMSLEPTFSTISAKETDAIKGSVYSPKGILSATKYIWVRITGD